MRGPGNGPVFAYGTHRHAYRRGERVQSQLGGEANSDHACCDRFGVFQRFQGIVDRQQLPIWHRDGQFGGFLSLLAATLFEGRLLEAAVNENASHYLGELGPPVILKDAT